jgi:hypothetical protein
VTVSWTHPAEGDVFQWVVYQQYGDSWQYDIVNRKDRLLTIENVAGEKRLPLNKLAVAAVDRMGNEGARKEVQTK